MGSALGIRLASAGIATTTSRGKAGRLRPRDARGFTLSFDHGPSAITDPDSFAELWRLTGQDMASDITLDPVTPLWRLNWLDGSSMDLPQMTP